VLFAFSLAYREDLNRAGAEHRRATESGNPSQASIATKNEWAGRS